MEAALYQHPDVLEAGVVGLPDPLFGEVRVAFVALRQGRSVVEAQLLAHARTVLSDYKVPEQIFFLDAIPKGLTGKVDRRRVRDLPLTKADSIKYPAPSGSEACTVNLVIRRRDRRTGSCSSMARSSKSK